MEAFSLLLQGFEAALTPENLLKARRMCEAFDDGAGECAA